MTLHTRLQAVAFASALAVCAPLLATGAAAGTLPRELDPLVQNMDTSVSPGTDFFQYACGKWIREHPIPATERGWGIGNLVQEQVYQQLLGICETAARSRAPKGSSEQKVGDLWATGMDSTRVDRLGTIPIQSYLREIAATRSKDDVLHVMAHLRTVGVNPLYSLFINQDARNSEKYFVHLYQGGLHLPDRGYYVDRDSSTRHVRDEYGRHVVAMFRLLGDAPAGARQAGADVMRIETALAERSRTLEQRRDPWANYHKMSVTALSATTPHIDWKRQLGDMRIVVDSVIVGQPEFLARADSLLAVEPLAAWKNYLRWSLLTSVASELSRPIDHEHFHFYGTVLSGAKTERPRWKRVLDVEENGIGEVLGQEWVKRYCSPAVKARYAKLTEDIIDVYRDRIRALPWMSAQTKQRALAKLDHVTRKVAYPDKWRDFSALRLDRGSYVGNTMAIDGWWFRHEADKLGKPIDRTEWDMTPQTYNAYYNGSQVEIVLPAAAFLIPGVPDSLVDDALLYSYAGGSTIGHEITHGFDDRGRQSDEHGNLNPWWTDQDSTQFAARAQKLVDQFDAYVVGDKHVRGRATLGENIADLGGIRLGYEAFKKTEQYRRHEVINGLTPDQRYFLGYALSWLGQRRPAALAQQIMSDVHAPQNLRVNGPLANIPEFYAAFGIKPGDPMYRDDSVRVEIW